MGTLFAPGSRNPSAGMYAMTANVIKSVFDSACAQISKEKPRAFILPKKGDYRLKRKARLLTKYVDGVMQGRGFYSTSEDVFRDGCIYGDGYLWWRVVDEEIRCQLVKVDEYVVDEVDGMQNRPTEGHVTTTERRTDLLARYPDREKEINEARSSWRGEMSYMGQADLVETIYSWRLPSRKKNGDSVGDGRWAISIGTCTLESGEYDKDYLPVQRWQWTVPTYGPFGDGIAKELYGAQRVLTDVLRGIVKSIRMFAVPRVWVSKTANVAQQTVTNEISVNTYAGEKPVFETPAAASADIYQFVQWLIDYCYKQIGISQMSSQSEKPAGLNSGVAMRTYQDVETQRFAIAGQRWERFYEEAARIIIDISRDLYKDSPSLSVKVRGRGFIQTIDWKDAALEDDEFDLGVWPTSILPETPEGKRQEATEWVQSGFMSQSDAVDQMRMPILNDWANRMTASNDAIEWALGQIIEEGKYVKPNALLNLQEAVTYAKAALLEAPQNGLEPHKQDLLLRFLQDAGQQLAASQAPPPAPAAPGGPVGQATAPPPAPMAPHGAGPIAAPSGP